MFPPTQNTAWLNTCGGKNNINFSKVLQDALMSAAKSEKQKSFQSLSFFCKKGICSNQDILSVAEISPEELQEIRESLQDK